MASAVSVGEDGSQDACLTTHGSDDNCYPITNQAEISGLPYAKDWGESSVDEIVELLCRVYANKHEARLRGEQGTKFMQDWSWEKRTKYLIDRISE